MSFTSHVLPASGLVGLAYNAIYNHCLWSMHRASEETTGEGPFRWQACAMQLQSKLLKRSSHVTSSYASIQLPVLDIVFRRCPSVWCRVVPVSMLAYEWYDTATSYEESDIAVWLCSSGPTNPSQQSRAECLRIRFDPHDEPIIYVICMTMYAHACYSIIFYQCFRIL